MKGEDMMKIEYYDNILTAEDFLQLYKEMHYEPEPREQLEQALKNGLFSVTAKENGKIIGMGRLVGDGFMYCYIQDVRVSPPYQNKGIGKTIVNKIIQYASQNGIHNTNISIGLMSAKGKEGFYEKLGFIRQPNDTMGFGMMKEITVE